MESGLFIHTLCTLYILLTLQDFIATFIKHWMHMTQFQELFFDKARNFTLRLLYRHFTTTFDCQI